MEEVQLFNFQNNVYDVINSVVNSHQPVIIRDKGKFLVKIVPVLYPEQESWLGCMKSKGRITGDIISPAEDTENWKVLSE
ncbi:MAG: type II toxin-antitoxin system Phd/YefM family antitoxin [Desulfamplus sp.]|nr:type II toxin-antitoxin system Phd/YefM family antitoxin [Desulfamplus sp.]